MSLQAESFSPVWHSGIMPAALKKKNTPATAPVTPILHCNFSLRSEDQHLEAENVQDNFKIVLAAR